MTRKVVGSMIGRMAPGRKPRQSVRMAMLVAGVLGFGLLMGLRGEIPTAWGRVAVAGIAFMWFAVMVLHPAAKAREFAKHRRLAKRA